MRYFVRHWCMLVCLMGASFEGQCVDSDLDTSFQATGVVTDPFDLGGSKADFGADLLLTVNGQLWGVGPVVSDTGERVGVVRRNQSGSLISRSSYDLGTDFEFEVANVDAANALYVGGSRSASADGGPDGVIYRVGSGGLLDPNYGGAEGFVRLSGTLGTREKVLAIQPFGSGLSALFSATNGSSVGTIYQEVLDANGIGVESARLNSAALVDAALLAADPAGRGVVAFTEQTTETTCRLVLQRSLSPINLTPDTTFGTGGIARLPTPMGAVCIRFTDIAFDPQGRLVLSGWYITTTSRYVGVLMRVTSQGTADTSFGPMGLTTVPVDLGNNDAQALAIQSDGKIVSVGSYDQSESGQWRLTLARVNTDGSFDGSFSTLLPYRSYDFQSAMGVNPVSFGADLVSLPDGRIVAFGTRLWQNSDYDFAWIKILGTEALFRNSFE